MARTVIDVIYDDNFALLEYLRNQNETSYMVMVQDNFKRSLLLGAASYFETLITSILINFFSYKSSNDNKVVSFIKIKSLNRNYFSLFDWDKNNANGFFSLFGSDFKTKMVEIISKSDLLDKSIKSFLSIGKERNKLVHQNFGEVIIEQTVEEIYANYKSALHFIDILNRNLNGTILL